MPTVLLRMIYDLLTKTFIELGQKIEDILDKLGLLEEIKEDTGAIKDDVSDIKDDVGLIATDTATIVSNTTDIKTNTGAVVTPVNQIRNSVVTISANVANMDDNIESIENAIGTISTNVGRCAGFDEDIATNTLNTYNKVVTIASDTTQMRADNQVIIGLLQDILTELQNS